MKIHLAPMGVPNRYSAIPDLEELAAHRRNPRHTLVASAEEADACLFVDCHNLGDPITLASVWKTPTFQHFRGKCYVYDQRPRAYCNLPGIYSSVPRQSFRTAFQVPWGYHKLGDPRQFLAESEPDIEPDLLFSFVGTGKSHPSRQEILKLSHPRAVIRSVDGHVNWEPDQPGYDERRADFARTTLRSKFVLCPRGRATSSIRFYEAMMMGRVPVVIADDWVAPKGIDLERFAIRWPEHAVGRLNRYLESREEDAAAMGAEAAKVFDRNFAPDVQFDRIGDLLEDLVATGPWDTFPRYGFAPDARVVRHVFGRARKLAMRSK